MREADSTSNMTESHTTVSYSDSDIESYKSDSSYTHSGPLFVLDNELSDMTDVTGCNKDTDEKVNFHEISHQIIIIINRI